MSSLELSDSWTESRMVGARGWGRRLGGQCLLDRVSLWEDKEVLRMDSRMSAQEWECPRCHRIAHSQMVKMLNAMCILLQLKKKRKEVCVFLSVSMSLSCFLRFRLGCFWWHQESRRQMLRLFKVGKVACQGGLTSLGSGHLSLTLRLSGFLVSCFCSLPCLVLSTRL